ncbi:MAG: thioredoxin-dependent thiol peroxidase [Flavipsychrobacter sp.]
MTLKAGDKAPDFTALDQNGNTISLHDFKGKKVALYFYPKDDTPTCTVEACNLRDNFAVLKKKGIVVIGVSKDEVKKHKKFETKYSLPFILVSDVDTKINNDYGVWALKKFMGREYMGTLRTTFLINEKGKIDHIIEDVESKNHTQQILDTWGL